jgi:thiamine-monophosphate kinase
MRDDGEFRLIARLAEQLPRPPQTRGAGAEVRVGIGDDAAVTVPGGTTVTSMDAFVDGIHFRREVAPMRSIGRKALAAALSDVAAMGASAGEAYVALGIPEEVGETACTELYEGLAGLAEETNTALLGGDVTRAPVLMLAIAVVGHAASPDAVVGRDGAAPGQALAVTGELGGAAAGLVLLEHPELAGELDPGLVAGLTQRQLEPAPMLAAGAALASAGASALIDLSDGLGADAAQIGAASGVLAEIELEQVPVQSGVAELAAAAGLDSADLATAGGEDYELLVALPEDRVAGAQSAVAAAGAALTVIGRTAPGEGVRIRRRDGSIQPARGFDHLRDRRGAAGPG